MADYEPTGKSVGSAVCFCGQKVEFKSNLVNATKCKCGQVILNRNYERKGVAPFDSKTPKGAKSIP
jgi:hypothetical protein